MYRATLTMCIMLLTVCIMVLSQCIMVLSQCVSCYTLTVCIMLLSQCVSCYSLTMCIMLLSLNVYHTILLQHVLTVLECVLCMCIIVYRVYFAGHLTRPGVVERFCWSWEVSRLSSELCRSRVLTVSQWTVVKWSSGHVVKWSSGQVKPWTVQWLLGARYCMGEWREGVS